MVDKKKRKRVPKTSLIEDIEADSYVGLKVKKSRKQNKVKEIDYDSNDEAEVIIHNFYLYNIIILIIFIRILYQKN